jgi:hypothetical protein
MIKKAFLEIIQKRLKAIDETNQFGHQYIEGVVDIYWQKFAFNYMIRSNMDPSFYTKPYTVTSVSTDSNGLYYIELPESIIRMPYGSYSTGAEGVVAMYAISASQWDLKPIREVEYYSIKNLEVYLAAKEHYYWVGYDKIFFSDNITTDIENNGVRMNLMIPFSKYTLTEDIPLPSDMDQVLSDYVVNYLLGTPLPDLTNDNSDDNG